jgi:hypothetical protein
MPVWELAASTLNKCSAASGRTGVDLVNLRFGRNKVFGQILGQQFLPETLRDLDLVALHNNLYVASVLIRLYVGIGHI